MTLQARPEGFFRRQNALILNAAGEGIYGLDLCGRVTFANPAAAGMTGHDVAELLGQPMHDLVHHSDPEGRRVPRERCPIYAAFADGAVHRVDSEVFWRKDGSCFPVDYSSTPIREHGVLVGAVVVFRDLSERRQVERRLLAALDEVRRLEQRLRSDQAPALAHAHTGTLALAPAPAIVGHSAALRAALSAAERVAATDATVLVQGESGTGKELIARAVHAASPRWARALVRVNCGALSASLVQSELFGHERGAFTGALARRRGRFELADRGTLFLDEVGELPLATQATLLRVLQEGELERVGSSETVRVDVRVIAATNRDLAALVAAGEFRADLYHRLNVFPIALPPLRERRADLPELIAARLASLSQRLGRSFAAVSAQGMQRLMAYSFPGNVRELHNLLERAAILATGPVLEIGALPEPEPAPADAPAALVTQLNRAPRERRDPAREREHIVAALHAAGWKIAGADGAAAALGLHANTLRSRMQRLGIPTRSAGRQAAAR